jgi:hypothetical protein
MPEIKKLNSFFDLSEKLGNSFREKISAATQEKKLGSGANQAYAAAKQELFTLLSFKILKDIYKQSGGNNDVGALIFTESESINRLTSATNTLLQECLGTKDDMKSTAELIVKDITREIEAAVGSQRSH